MSADQVPAVISVDLDSEAIEAAFVRAVMDASLGERITEAVGEALKPARFGGQSPLQQAVASAVQAEARVAVLRILNSKPVRAKFEAAVQAELTSEVVNTIVSGAIMHLLNLAGER